MNTGLKEITRALNFAAQRHANQRRKGEQAEPYVNHLIDVVDMLARNGADADTIVAGALHDTVEDQGVTHAELKQTFNTAVADIVMECTDDKSLPKAERKRLQAEKAPHKSNSAKMVKIADKTSNLKSILQSPPADWNDARKLEYFEWSKKVIDGCRGINAGLEAEYDHAYQTGIRKFKAAA